MRNSSGRDASYTLSYTELSQLSSTRPSREHSYVTPAPHTSNRLHSARIDEAIAALRALTEHRDDLVRTRTQTVNRLHTVLIQLLPAGLPRGLNADAAAAALRGVRPRSALGRTQRALAVELMAITQIRHDTPGQAYYRRKRAEGKNHKEALRCLKRRLSDAVYRTVLRDADTSLVITA